MMLIVKQGGTKYHFLSFGITRTGIGPQSPGPLADTLLIKPMDRSNVVPINVSIKGLFSGLIGTCEIFVFQFVFLYFGNLEEQIDR